MVRLSCSACGLALALLTPMRASAQEAGAFELGEVVVTGRRPPLPGAERVVTREDLDRLNLDRLSEALERTAGLTLTPGARGGPRGESRIFIRSFDGTQTVLSLDGVPFYGPYDGEPTDLARFTTFDLAEVEVVKGFGSVLDGPNALGGRINLVSRRPEGPLGGELRAAVDLDNAGFGAGGRVSLQGGGARGRTYVQGGASLIERDHTRLPGGFAPGGPRTPAGGGLSAGFLEDGRRRNRSHARDLQVNLKAGFRPRSGEELAVFAWRQESERGVPPYAGPPVPGQTFNFFDWPQWDRAGAAAAADIDLGPVSASARAYVDSFRNRLLGFDDDRYATQQLRLGRVFDTPYDDRAVGGSLTLSGEPWRGGRLGAAAHLRRDRHAETPNTLPGRETPTFRFEDLTRSLGLELEQTLAPGLSLALGAALQSRTAERAEDQQAGGASFPLGEAEALDAQAGLSWRPEAGPLAGGAWFAGLARKSRFASQFERYSYRLGAALPNPTLEAERATHWQLGWRGAVGPATAEAAVFRIEIEDAIQRATVSATGVTQFRNVGAASHQGVELTLRAGGAGLDYTYLERESDASPPVVLFGTPRHALSAFIDLRLSERLRFTPAVVAFSDRNTSDLAGGEPVGGFLRADAKLSYRLRPEVRLELVGHNLFDTLYALDRGFPEEGRRLSFGLRVRR